MMIKSLSLSICLKKKKLSGAALAVLSFSSTRDRNQLEMLQLDSTNQILLQASLL